MTPLLVTLHEVQEASYRQAGRGILSAWPPEQALDAAGLTSFLVARCYCVLATATARGHPQARPVAFTVLDETFWFGSGDSGRLRNVERTPWVSVVVSEGERDAHRAVIAEGPVTILPEPPAGLLDAWEGRFGSRADWAVAWLELRPERLFSYDSGA